MRGRPPGRWLIGSPATTVLAVAIVAFLLGRLLVSLAAGTGGPSADDADAGHATASRGARAKIPTDGVRHNLGRPVAPL